MLTVLIVLAVGAVVLVMTTLGAVLLARFALGRQGAPRRVAAAALGGPASLLLPALGMLAFEQGSLPGELALGIGVLLLIGAGVIGWPVAHLATRRLDRLSAFDPQIFE